MKKIVATVLIITFMFTSIVSAATNMHKLDYETVIEFENSQENFYNIFDINKNQELTKQNISIDYSYKLVDAGEYYTLVDMFGYIEINNSKNFFNAIGEVESYVLDAGDKVLYGSIDGEIDIKGQTYNLIIGFDKKNSDEFITTTIYNKTKETILVFGIPVVSITEKNAISKIRKDKEVYKNEDSPIYLMSRGSNYDTDFSYVESAKGNLIDNSGNDLGERGIQLRLYKSDYDITSTVLQIRVKSYVDSLTRSYAKGNPVFYDLKLVELNTSLDFDVGHCDGTAPAPSDEGSGLLKSILYDALSHYCIPTNTLDAIYSSARGKIKVKHNMYNPEITIKAGWGDEIYCDDEYQPLFFGVATNRFGKVSGKYEGYLKYKITTNTPRVGMVSFYRKAIVSDKFSVIF